MQGLYHDFFSYFLAIVTGFLATSSQNGGAEHLYFCLRLLGLSFVLLLSILEGAYSVQVI